METNQKNQEESALALILAEVRKLTKHFKLDRKSRSNADDPDGAENSDEESERLLCELSDKVEKIADRKYFTAEQVAKLETMLNPIANVIAKKQGEHHEELKSSLDRMGQALDMLKAEKRDSVVLHRHAIDIVSSKVCISMIVMGLLILGLSYVVGDQRRTISQFRDNDLKYRYVKMHGSATPGELKALEMIFTYDPHPDSIRIIRRQVIQYERLVKEQAEKIEQARLNASEAERLRKEVETVKGGK